MSIPHTLSISFVPEFLPMPFPDSLVFDTTEQWAVGSADGIVNGRIPSEDQFPAMDFISRLLWPRHSGSMPLDLPVLRESAHATVDSGDRVTAGPYNSALSVSIPESFSNLLGLPKADVGTVTPSVVSVSSSEPVTVTSIPVCTDPSVFQALKPDQHPPHPVIQFLRPVDHVHVNMTDDSGKVLWDSTYDLDGRAVLDSKLTPVGIGTVSKVPEYIPACSVGGSTHFKLRIDAEQLAPMKINFINKASNASADAWKDEIAPTRPNGPSTPQAELETPDAMVCKIAKEELRNSVLKDDVEQLKAASVHLPGKYGNALWRMNRSREESSDLNPHGVPMLDISQGKGASDPAHVNPLLAKLAPTSIGTGKAAVHLIPRRPHMSGEIQIDQLERGNFSQFDSRHYPKNIHEVDKTAILSRPSGFMQPSVKRTVYSEMWQGTHAGKEGGGTLHPSVQFKHAAGVARVTLTDVTDKKVLWDALYDVKGNHKIAADQVAVGGSKPAFAGIDPPTGEEHLYKITVDADNPGEILAGTGREGRLVDFWRQSEFLFGATRPSLHSEADIMVTPAHAPAASGGIFHALTKML